MPKKKGSHSSILKSLEKLTNRRNTIYMDAFINSPYRFIFGISFFVIVGSYDYYKNPTNPVRAKEYLFFCSVSLLASCFAVFHDFITFHISPKYFELGKGLGEGISFFPEVLILALKASYWVGIVIGALFLVANNNSEKLKKLSYPQLYRFLLFPLFFSVFFAIVSSFVSLFMFPLIVSKSFSLVLAIHRGTYVGALVGTIVAITKIYFMRRKKL